MVPCQRSTLQVVCGKGKGKKTMRRGRSNQQMGMDVPPTPPVDPNDEEFVIFVRSTKFPLWYPYSIMKGGWAANALVKSQESDWMKNMTGGQLVKNISEALYKEYDEVSKQVRSNYPMLKNAQELQFGFKLRDKSKPDDWYKPIDIQALLPREEVGNSVVGNMMDSVQNLFGGDKK